MGKEKKGKRGRYYFLFLIGSLLIFLFYVWECAEVVRLGYKISELKKEFILLESKNCQLKTKLYRYTNLANIDKIAREEKGMISPQHENVVFLKANFEKNKISGNKSSFH